RALASEIDDVAADLHTRVKAAWDPDGILNPGKSLPRW
ncbi:MAG: FAD-binding protein, partial [Actinomycetota bacterium]|nr:FAD-binding protein [Actinomycetota bacterium]